MSSSILEASSLNQYYGDSHTLWDVSLDIKKGSCLCVLGRNGVGKTTLMESLMGLLPLESGKIVFNGLELSDKSAESRARNGIGYVPQGRQIFPLLTVEENIFTGLFARKGRIGSVPSFIYDLFPVLKEMRTRRGGDLSGGQQQQLAFARALAIEPSLLLLDEPTEGIQPNIVQEIGDVILRLNKEHDIAVALVEQKLPFARRMATDYLLLDRGRVVSHGSMDALDEQTIKRYLTV